MTTEQKKEEAPKMVEVDLGDSKLSLPEGEAAKIIQWRDAEKSAKRDLAGKYGKLEAEKAAAEAAKLKAEDDKQAIEHAKKGEIDEARAIMTRETDAKIKQLARSARDKHLAAMISSNDSIIKSAVPDIVEQWKAKTDYDFNSDSVVVLDSDGSPAKDKDGKPVQADAALAGWLENRPHYRRDGTQKGTGAASGTKPSGKSITKDDFKQMTPTDQGKFLNDGGKILK